MMLKMIVTTTLTLVTHVTVVNAFLPPRAMMDVQCCQRRAALLPLLSSASNTEEEVVEAFHPVAVVAPLKYIGNLGYPCLTLEFEHSTLDFVLATGCNINTINPETADTLQLPILDQFEDAPIVSTGMGGAYMSGNSVYLGDCALAGVEPKIPFLTGLEAATFSTIVGDGLLGIQFFLSFENGVEFDWYGSGSGSEGDPQQQQPTIVFYFQQTEELVPANENIVRVPLTRLPISVLSLPVIIDGYEVPALLVTCSPITVISPQVAESLGIESSADEFVVGIDGKHIYKSARPVALSAGAASLGSGHVYIGDLPGVQFLNSIDTTSPNVVLGLDFLRQSRRMILKLNANEIYFEAL